MAFSTFARSLDQQLIGVPLPACSRNPYYSCKAMFFLHLRGPLQTLHLTELKLDCPRWYRRRYFRVSLPSAAGDRLVLAQGPQQPVLLPSRCPSATPSCNTPRCTLWLGESGILEGLRRLQGKWILQIWRVGDQLQCCARVQVCSDSGQEAG